MRRWLSVVVTCLAAAAAFAASPPASLYDFVYTDVPAAPCVRLLNATSVVGCQSPTVAAPLYLVSNANDLATFTQVAPAQPWAVLLSPALFTPDNLQTLRASGKLAGVVVLAGPLPAAYSPTSPCPNCDAGLYAGAAAQTQWNPAGNYMDSVAYDFPVFRLLNESQPGVLAAANYNAQRQYAQYPLYAVEFDAFMWAITDSETCLRRGQCDPVGGNTVWATLQPLLSGRSVIVLSARLDASAFFHDLAFGAEGDTSAVVALLAAAEAMSRLNFASFDKNVLFALFDAETWGYAGSQRFVDDVQSFVCSQPAASGNPNQCDQPLKLDLAFTKLLLRDIDAVIELSQVAGLGYASATAESVLYAHVDNTNTTSENLLTLVRNISDTTTYSRVYPQPFLGAAYEGLAENPRLPPASLQSFLLARPSIAGVVITDFQTQFANPFYLSELDTVNLLTPTNVAIVCDAATLAARSAVALANLGQQLPADFAADCTLVEELLTCLLANFTCPLVAKYIPPNAQSTLQPSHYAGVFRFGTYSGLSKFVHDYLGDVLATARNESCTTSSDCLNADMQCIASVCLMTNVHYHDAYGTGLQYSNDLGRFTVVNASKPAWTESQWLFTRMRVFQVASTGSEVGQFFGGVIVAVVAVAVAVLVRRMVGQTVQDT